MRLFPCCFLPFALCSMPAAAVMVDPSHHGEVLVFPYYTVQHGQQTLLSIVNSGSSGKALKVRFRESWNGREVYAFNLYMAEYDVWTAALHAIDASGPARLLSLDHSCTVPTLARTVHFSSLPSLDSFGTAEFSQARADGGPTSPARTREGYIEVIEMGTLANNSDSDKAATHVGGVPQNCDNLVRAWQPGGYWQADPTVDLQPPSGQLGGSASIIDATAGTTYATRATALSRFSIAIQHTAHGNALPDLSSAVTDPQRRQVDSVTVSEGQVLRLQWPQEQAIDAVSAALSQSQVENEFNIRRELAAATDWVVTFPTRRHYTDPALTGGVAIAPFTGRFDPTAESGACELFQGKPFNREGGRPTGDIIPPPLRNYCNSAQVLSFNNGDVARSPVLGAAAGHRTQPLQFGQFLFSEGFHLLMLEGAGRISRPALGGERLHGLPAIGFAANRYRNASGSLHTSTVPHAGRVHCVRADGTPCGGT